jgi:hypothetical protein
VALGHPEQLLTVNIRAEYSTSEEQTVVNVGYGPILLKNSKFAAVLFCSGVSVRDSIRV